MKYPREFLDEIKARLRLSDVVAPHVRLSRSGRYMRGLSPFNAEKTPSFFVDDQKGSFTCYSSGERGDHFDFIMKVRGLSLPEAVELLAADAGLELPKPDPEQERRAKKAASLTDLLEVATSFFEGQLRTPSGQHALDYLKGRGLGDATLSTFRLGYAPASFGPLQSFLEARGFTLAQMIDAGLANRSQHDSSVYGVFRNRVIFPIADWRGRIVGFGGRALSSEEKAKYLNSPKTQLFDKSSTLYNFHRARDASRNRRGGQEAPLVVAEGYMDVIAFHDAGVSSAVAPLGTAITETHIESLWRITEEPLLCLDGDAAGLKAAYGVCERVLPLLTPGKSLWFCLLPNGQDPDDIVRNEGAAALRDALEDRVPLVDMIWKKELEQKELTTPDRRAGFQQSLRDLVKTIKDPTVRQHYSHEFEAKLAALMQPVADRDASKFGGSGRRGYEGQRARQPWHNRAKRQPFPNGPVAGGSVTSALMNSAIVKKPATTATRDDLLVLTVINHPEILDDYFEEFASLKFTNPLLDRLQSEIITIAGLGESLERSSLHDHLVQQGCSRIVTRLTALPIAKTHDFVKPETEAAIAITYWRDSLLLRSKELAKTDLRALEENVTKNTTHENYERLVSFKADENRREHEFDQND